MDENPALVCADLAAGARLFGADLSVAAGERWALIGSRGAGGRTMLRAVAGHLSLRGGALSWGGVSLAGVPAHRRRFPWVDGNAPGLAAHRSLRENVELPLLMRGLARAERRRRADAVLSALGLAGIVAELRPARADPDARARAALARALVPGAPCVLLADPFAAVAPAEAALLAAWVADALRWSGSSAVFRFYGNACLWPAATHAALMEGGRITAAGPLRALYESPPTVAAALALGPMNFFPGTVVSCGDEEAELRLDAGPVHWAPAAPGAERTPGQRAVLGIRPERLAVAPGHAAAFGDGAVDATLRMARMEGAIWRLTLIVAPGREVTVTRPAGIPPPGPAGSPMALAWQAEAARIF